MVTTTQPIVQVAIDRDYNAVLTVPQSNVHEYAGLKSAQLSMLVRLISDHAAGHEIQLSEDDMWALTSFASEMAFLNKGLVAAIAYSPGVGEKGGA